MKTYIATCPRQISASSRDRQLKQAATMRFPTIIVDINYLAVV